MSIYKYTINNRVIYNHVKILIHIIIYIICTCRGWWISKTVELICAATATRRLAIFKDTTLVDKLPALELIRIINTDKVLLARTNVQNRVLKILNSKIHISDRMNLYPNRNDVREELLDIISTIDIIGATEAISQMNVARLVSLIHGFTGELPVLSSIHGQTSEQTDDEDSLHISTTNRNSVSSR